MYNRKKYRKYNRWSTGSSTGSSTGRVEEMPQGEEQVKKHEGKVMMKKPPSRFRYERTHPTVSVRLDLETREKIRELVKAEGKTLSAFLKDFVKNKKEKWDKAYKSGYDKGASDYCLWFDCSVCGKKVYIAPDTEAHEVIKRHMKGWGHPKCIEEKE